MAKLAMRPSPSGLIAAMVVVATILAFGSSAPRARAGESAPRPGDFVPRVDNPWFPLIPGTTFVYRGAKDGKKSRDVYTVTRTTKTI